MHLSDPELGTIGHAGHGFFTRRDGVSEGIYASLNCGPGSADDAAAVTENRARAMAALGLPASALVTNYQIHSPHVVTVTEPWQRAAAPRADAMVTGRPGIALGILTADCAPVLFADTQARVVGAAHAGWRGALAGVLANTVAAMEHLGARRGRIVAAIGPCIAQASYEVGTAFLDEFRAREPFDPSLFAAGTRDGHWQFNLPGYVAAELARQDIAAVRDLAVDTYADGARFFSYRRATHRAEPDYGRQLSAIFIKPE